MSAGGQGQQKGGDPRMQRDMMMQQQFPGYGMGGGFYSMGNSMRGRPDFASPPGHPFGRPGAPQAPQGDPGMGNPFARGPNNIQGNFGSGSTIGGTMTNALNRGQFDPYGIGNITPTYTSTPFNPPSNPGSFPTAGGFGPPAPNYAAPTSVNPNADPNSPEYAAYYNSLAPSTRAFLAAPGSADAAYKFNLQNTPGVMNFR